MKDELIIQLLMVGTCLVVLFAASLIALMWIQKRNQNIFHAEKERWQRSLIEERERTMNEVSSDVHNHIMQIVSFSQMMLKAAVDSSDKAEASVYINQVTDMLARIGDDLQMIRRRLSSDFIQQWGLFRVLENEMEYIEVTHKIHCRLDVEGEKRILDVEKELLVYRIIQDAINNILKNAKATEIEILFRYRMDNTVQISVSDDGIPMLEGESRSLSEVGIANMRERANLLKADLDISSDSERGFRVTLSFSLDKKNEENFF